MEILATMPSTSPSVFCYAYSSWMQGVYCRYCRCLNKLSPKNFLADGGGDESAELSLASGNGGGEGLLRRNSLGDLKLLGSAKRRLA